jgi:hypothetical protein
MSVSRGSLKRDNLPQPAWLVEPGFESALVHSSQNQRWRMQEDSELQPDDSKPKVGKGQTKSGPPATVRKAHDQHALGAIGYRASELGHVRIAADHTIHDDDVGGLNFDPRLREVHHQSLDAITQAGLDQEFAGSDFIGGIELNVHRSGDTGLEQLDLDGSDATPHLEKRLAYDAPLPDEIKDSL